MDVPTTSVQTLHGDDRRMVKAELMGSHSHETLKGDQVHVWVRSGKYLARGSYERHRFGDDLGGDVSEASARLRRILTEIENGTYVRPSLRQDRMLSQPHLGKLTLRQLMDAYLLEIRKLRGQETANDYRSRLMHTLEFSELQHRLKQWPLAASVDREFAVELRSFLHERTTTRNGRAGGVRKLLSSHHILNILECLQTMLNWARSPQVRKLPPQWLNPLTPDIVGSRPAKNPLRENPLPMETRIALVRHMDAYQFRQLALLFMLPMRPDEAAGLLVSDVCFTKGWLSFKTRFGGADYNKGRVDFVLPFPKELTPFIQSCIGGRAEGPLLQCSPVLAGRRKPRQIESSEQLQQMLNEWLLRDGPSARQNEQNRKKVFRKMLRWLGGVSEDELGRQFKRLLQTSGQRANATVSDLRDAITTEMNGAKLPHLELRYLTSHTTTDILNEYVGLDPAGAMENYFEVVQQLIDALVERSEQLGLVEETLDSLEPEPHWSEGGEVV